MIELINAERGCWKVKVIKDTLDAEEAKLVYNIPISSSGQRDKVI